jgi:hypothetical protein
MAGVGCASHLGDALGRPEPVTPAGGATRTRFVQCRAAGLRTRPVKPTSCSSAASAHGAKAPFSVWRGSAVPQGLGERLLLLPRPCRSALAPCVGAAKREGRNYGCRVAPGRRRRREGLRSSSETVIYWRVGALVPGVARSETEQQCGVRQEPAPSAPQRGDRSWLGFPPSGGSSCGDCQQLGPPTLFEPGLARVSERPRG